MARRRKQFLLVEAVAKTPYPPLGLMKISSMLKARHRDCTVVDAVGTQIPKNVRRPTEVFITTLFTWDLPRVVKVVHFCQDNFPHAKIHVGGIAASLMPVYISERTDVEPHVGLHAEAEDFSPDYSARFCREIDSSIAFATRGCPRNCGFCSVRQHEPQFHAKRGWEKDICSDLPRIAMWDNNFLASPNLESDIQFLKRTGKRVDFNQGLDARLYKPRTARMLSEVRVDPIRFAFDHPKMEKHIVRAVELAREHCGSEIRVYVLYNYRDTPQDFYYRINLLNKIGALAFPMEYRPPTPSNRRFPGPHWDSQLLRALKLSLLYYYRRGMITESRRSFVSIYGRTAKRFVDKLYDIFEYDKNVCKKRYKAYKKSASGP